MRKQSNTVQNYCVASFSYKSLHLIICQCCFWSQHRSMQTTQQQQQQQHYQQSLCSSAPTLMDPKWGMQKKRAASCCCCCLVRQSVLFFYKLYWSQEEFKHCCFSNLKRWEAVVCFCRSNICSHGAVNRRPHRLLATQRQQQHLWITVY